jgi:hydrogenase expression/formation protein HypC
MCLGVPGLVVEVDELTALVDFWGVRRRVRLDLVDEPVAIGDYVLNHVGFAIRAHSAGGCRRTLALVRTAAAEPAERPDGRRCQGRSRGGGRAGGGANGRKGRKGRRGWERAGTP